MPHTFTGRTLIEAQQAAEDALGPDAVVLDRRRVKKKGVAGLLGGAVFEVEAGLPVDAGPAGAPPVDPKPTMPALPAALVQAAESLQSARSFSSSAYGESSAAQAEIVRLHREVRAMRALLYRMQNHPSRLEGELKQLRRAMGTMKPKGGPKNQVTRWLEESGIDGPVAEKIIEAMRGQRGNVDRLHDGFRDALSEHIEVTKWPLATEGSKLIAVVGPPGVGKTTTLAKLAARAIADHDASVAFITCDTYRVGAIEHLARFAKMLEAPIAVAHDTDELHRAAAASDADIVLVDTAGRGPDGEHSSELGLAEPRGWARRERHVLLCLDASTRAADAEMLSERYLPCAPTAIAVTKLDLTQTPGALVHGTGATELPLSTLCHGQRVPEDLSPATAGRVIEHLAPRAIADWDAN